MKDSELTVKDEVKIKNGNILSWIFPWNSSSWPFAR